MNKPKAFLEIKRQTAKYRPVWQRIRDYREVTIMRADAESMRQASRCLDCGTPFCHWACPLGNFIPEYNDLVSAGQWKRALELLLSVNNFPEITGRLCPALCEYSCVLGINDEPVTCRENELAVIEHAFKNNWIKPRPPEKRTGRKIAVVGSGPAGLAAADQLNKYGHKVTVFEKDKKTGGFLRYGIPDFKLDKRVLDRRVNILKQEGIKFTTGIDVGRDYPVSRLKKEFNAVCLAIGSRAPRDLKIKSRELKGIYFAVEFLAQTNEKVFGQKIPPEMLIDAKGKKVVVIGGGDTGADCAGTANRQGAKRVIQIEVMPQPPQCRTEDYPWPRYPLLLKTSSSHEEGVGREWSILTKEFMGDKKGNVKKIACVRVGFPPSGRSTGPGIKEIPGSEFEIEADLVILAIGFMHPQHRGLLEKLKLKYDARGNVSTDNDYMTSVRGIFSAGDMHCGQSLIVRAVAEGRNAAKAIDSYLKIKKPLCLPPTFQSPGFHSL